MVTMQEFLTHTKGVEYGISVLFLVGYTAYWGLIKEKPYDVLRRTVREDMVYLRSCGLWRNMKLISKIVGAPLLGLAYLVGLPFIFLFTVFFFIGKRIFGQRGAETTR